MNTGGRGRKEKPWGIPTFECLNEHLAYGGGAGNDSQLNRLYVQVCTRYNMYISFLSAPPDFQYIFLPPPPYFLIYTYNDMTINHI